MFCFLPILTEPLSNPCNFLTVQRLELVPAKKGWKRPVENTAWIWTFSGKMDKLFLLEISRPILQLVARFVEIVPELVERIYILWLAVLKLARRSIQIGNPNISYKHYSGFIELCKENNHGKSTNWLDIRNNAHDGLEMTIGYLRAGILEAAGSSSSTTAPGCSSTTPASTATRWGMRLVVVTAPGFTSTTSASTATRRAMRLVVATAPGSSSTTPASGCSSMTPASKSTRWG